MIYQLTFQKGHLDAVRDQVLGATGDEGITYVLCGRADVKRDPWANQPYRHYLSREVVVLNSADIVSISSAHIQARTRTFASLLKRARDEDLTIIVVHSHPNGVARFSKQDDQDEPRLIELAQHRNGSNAEVISLIVTGDGELTARVWVSSTQWRAISLIKVIGERWGLHYPERFCYHTKAEFQRQTLAFGPALTRDIQTLRFGIVGCGATGSAVALLLGRMGALELACFDKDHAETSNQNRLHGSGPSDIRDSVPKVMIMKRMIDAMGFGANVQVFPNWVNYPTSRSALLSCDVIFGCTDDHDGRLFLNRIAYFYLIPVIDMGIGIDVSGTVEPRVLDAASRVTVLQPGYPCLVCRNVINTQLAREEILQRTNPEEYRRQKQEAYVRGGENPAPSVVTFTTDVACMAMDELLHRLTGYRRVGSIAQRVRKYLLSADKTPGREPRTGCQICDDLEIWGRGDITPFLDRVE